MKKIKVNLKNQNYNIFYEKNLLKSDFIVSFCQKLANKFVIITHTNLIDLFADPLAEKFRSKNLDIKILSFEKGEINKSRKTKEFLEDQMLSYNFSKDTLVIAIGGGVVIDMAGFVCSTYMRGIDYVIIPTTLLAMVDASIGGKTAINTEHGKNLIGCIYHPKAVFIDFEVLKYLSKDEIKNGYIEMLKHSLILDKKSFTDLLNTKTVTEKQIIHSLKIKKNVIEKDENEKSFRKVLNFGHTISHAIEAISNYEISHGKALCFGILIESHLSYKMNLLSLKEFKNILEFLKLKKLLNNAPKISKDKIIDFIKRDKKNIFSKNRFTLLKNIGKSIINVEIIENYIVESLVFILGGNIC